MVVERERDGVMGGMQELEVLRMTPKESRKGGSMDGGTIAWGSRIQLKAG